jgi:hypothetical protein
MKIESKIRKSLGFKVGSMLIYHLLKHEKSPNAWHPFYDAYSQRLFSGMSLMERKKARWLLEREGFLHMMVKRNGERTTYLCRMDESCLRRIANEFGVGVLGVGPGRVEGEKPKQRVSPVFLGALQAGNIYGASGHYRMKYGDQQGEPEETDPTIKWFKKVWTD